MVKAQISPITIILVSGIVISLVGVTYMWGAPLIEKQSIKTRFAAAAAFMKSLDNTIVDIANSGGSTEMEIPFGLAVVIPDGREKDSNSITFQFSSSQPLISSNTTTYLGDVSYEDIAGEVGIFGTSRPGVISLSSQPSGQGVLVTMRLHYRELDSSSPLAGYKISLEKVGRGSGPNKITLSSEGSETTAGGAANSGDLILTKINVRIS